MRPLPRTCAFLSGVLLHEAIALLAGVTAAIAVPQAYFAWFGRAQGPLALVLLDLVVFAIPAAIVNAGGLLAAERLLCGSARTVVLGYLAGFLFHMASNVLMFAALSEGAPSAARLLPPWWTLPGLLLPWMGFAVAAWLLRRTRTRQHP